MRILIAGSSSKLFHLEEFGEKLTSFGVETKVVFDQDFSDGFPSRKISHWLKNEKKFKKLVDEFKPDLVIVDRQRHFGLSTINAKIPLFIHLRGDYWREMEIARETIYASFFKRMALKKWKEIGDKCFNNATAIIPICNYLKNKTEESLPNIPSFVMYQGIEPNNWFEEKGIVLEHPCVGLLQGAVIWDKAKEMLTLENVLKKLPDVKFYWVGDGPFREKILSKLSKYDNFIWLGALEYPKKVRQFLSEIDVYMLISGLDMSPLTLLEAQLMKKPVIATNVGGIPELIIKGSTGEIVEKGDHKQIIKKIQYFLNEKENSKKFGENGRKFVIENFSWDVVTQKFILDLKKFF